MKDKYIILSLQGSNYFLAVVKKGITKSFSNRFSNIRFSEQFKHSSCNSLGIDSAFAV